jgi:predicted ATP-dependent endonuclease of OLD family
MYLSSLKTSGYRCFDNEFNISFNDGLNIMVGENGSGKSAIIDAIRTIISDEDWRFGITDKDFYRPFSNQAKASKQINIETFFSDLSQEEEIAFLTWADDNGGAKLNLVVENKEDNKGRYRKNIWGGVSKASAFETELFDSINCIYLPPLRDAEAKLKEGKGSRLARLLKNLSNNSRSKESLETKFKEFQSDLAKDENESIYKANDLIKKKLKESLGEVLGQETKIQFSETNFNRIVESLRLLFFPRINDDIEKEFRNLDENSLGYNNIIYLATILAELINLEENQSYLKILLIEEPEAHLHPQLQVRLLKYLQKISKEQKIQIVISTHSTIIASSVEVNKLIHLSKIDRKIKAVPIKNCNLKPESEKFINRWLDATKSTLLFAKGVILVEGIAEAMLVPVFTEKVLKEYNDKNPNNKIGESLEDAGVSVVNMNGIYFKHFFQLFTDINEKKDSKKEFIEIRCAGITDFDPKNEESPTKMMRYPDDESTNSSLILDDILETSTNCRIFISPYKTFEYDMAMKKGNLNIMIPVAKALIDTDGSIKETFEKNEKLKWEIVTDKSKKAEAAIYLLNHIDKGEYAQSLADELSKEEKIDEFCVPKYIKNAIIWACGGNIEE